MGTGMTVSDKQTTPHALQGVDRQHKPELDGIRGIAIMGVLLTHAIYSLQIVPLHVPGKAWGNVLATIFVPGWGGVDLFFTLSGFLITGILLKARHSKTYFTSFYMRRVLRIFPIYYLYLIVTLTLPHVSRGFDHFNTFPTGWRNIVPFFLYIQNWPVFWSNWYGIPTLWGVFWSLAVEEQFYTVWPTVVRFVKLRYIFWFCIVGFLLGFFERWYIIRHIGVYFGVMAWPFSRLDGLFVGSAIALSREIYGRPLPLRWAASAFVAGAAMFFWVAVLYTPELSSGNGLHIWRNGVTAYALMSGGLIAATQYPLPWLHRVLTVRPLLLAGRLSYGMYVYHLLIYKCLRFLWDRTFPLGGPLYQSPILTVLGISTAVLLTVGVAQVSFRYFEAPILSLKRYFPSPAAPVS